MPQTTADPLLNNAAETLEGPVAGWEQLFRSLLSAPRWLEQLGGHPTKSTKAPTPQAEQETTTVNTAPCTPAASPLTWPRASRIFSCSRCRTTSRANRESGSVSARKEAENCEETPSLTVPSILPRPSLNLHTLPPRHRQSSSTCKAVPVNSTLPLQAGLAPGHPPEQNTPVWCDNTLPTGQAKPIFHFFPLRQPGLPCVSPQVSSLNSPSDTCGQGGSAGQAAPDPQGDITLHLTRPSCQMAWNHHVLPRISSTTEPLGSVP